MENTHPSFCLDARFGGINASYGVLSKLQTTVYLASNKQTGFFMRHMTRAQWEF